MIQATLTRLVFGNLDAVQSVTGHKSAKLVEHYGTLSSDLQSQSISKVESFLKQKSHELEQVCATHVQNSPKEVTEINHLSNN